MSIDAKPIAYLDWSLDVDCPKCGEVTDLACSESDMARYIFQSAWDKLRGWEVTCAHCGHEFEIEKVEY